GAEDLPAGPAQRSRQPQGGSGDRSGDCRGHAIGRITPRRQRPAARSLLGHRAAAARHGGRPGSGRDQEVGRGHRCRGPDPPRRCMIKLSVNVNKIATVRNSRGGSVPSVLEAVRVCLEAGAPGITVHPRADARHITTADVREIAAYLRAHAAGVEFNIEGDPRPDLLDLVHEVKPDQCTLVPVKPGEITSQAGWPADTPRASLQGTIDALKRDGIRVSLFVDPEDAPIKWAADLGGDRVELYTEPFARAFERGDGDARAS